MVYTQCIYLILRFSCPNQEDRIRSETAWFHLEKKHMLSQIFEVFADTVCWEWLLFSWGHCGSSMELET